MNLLRRPAPLVAVMLIAAASVAAVAANDIAADKWQTYANTRYGVLIDYPADLFAIQPPPPDNAGRDFQAPAAKARFSIYTHANALDLSRDELAAEDVLDLGDAAAKKQNGTDWYQIIAHKDAETVLCRVLLSEGGTMVHRLEIAFPTRAAASFAPTVLRMAQSFRVDPAIPEKAAQAAEASTPPPAAEAGAASWQRIDSVALGLRIPNYRGKAGVSAEVPAHWVKSDMPEPNVIEFDGPQGSAEAEIYIIFRADLHHAAATLASEAKIIKTRLSEGADNYKLLSERNVTITGRPAIVFSVQFSGSDSPALLHEDVAIVDAGPVFYYVHFGAPDARYSTTGSAVFKHALDSISFAE
jgi:hypothetical protein